MSRAKSNIFRYNIKYTKHARNSPYVNNSHMCRLDKSFASK
jgi:hypothetical protein